MMRKTNGCCNSHTHRSYDDAVGEKPVIIANMTFALMILSIIDNHDWITLMMSIITYLQS